MTTKMNIASIKGGRANVTKAAVRRTSKDFPKNTGSAAINGGGKSIWSKKNAIKPRYSGEAKVGKKASTKGSAEVTKKEPRRSTSWSYKPSYTGSASVGKKASTKGNADTINVQRPAKRTTSWTYRPVSKGLMGPSGLGANISTGKKKPKPKPKPIGMGKIAAKSKMGEFTTYTPTRKGSSIGRGQAGAKRYSKSKVATIYTAKRGDTFNTISKKTGISVARLKKVNPWLMKRSKERNGQPIYGNSKVYLPGKRVEG